MAEKRKIDTLQRRKEKQEHCDANWMSEFEENHKIQIEFYNNLVTFLFDSYIHLKILYLGE